MASDFLTEFERALKERTNQLSPEERKIQTKQNLKKMAKKQILSPEERKMANRMEQLSPEEKKIQSKTNVERMGQKQIETRNAKAQAYIDKKNVEMRARPAYKAGRASAQAQRATTEAIKKAAPKAATFGRAISKAAVPIAAATELVRAGKLATDAEYRKENEQAYEDLAEKNFLQRAIEGGLGGVSTIYAAGKNIADAAGSYARANRSIIDARNKEKELIARGILDEEGRPTRLREAASEAMEAGSTGAIEGGATSPQFDGEALSRALVEAAPVQPAETAPRTPEVEAAYKEIEAGNVPKAIVVDESKLETPELDENRMAQLYRKTTGSVYNPEVSKAAREKMAQLKAFVSSNPEMLNKSDTKIALDFYRTL